VWPALPFMAFVAVLPFRGTVTLRLVCLAAAGLIVATSWRRLTPPALPCRWTIALWAGVVLGSLLVAVDPAYSVREIKNEVGYALITFVVFLAWTRSEPRLRLTGLAVLAGFVAMSGSVLLGAYLRGGEWPSDVYYGDVGAVSNYLVTVGPVLGLTVARLGHRHATRWLAVLGVPFLAVALLCAERALWPALGVQAALVCVWGWRVRAMAVGWPRLALAGLIVLGLVGGGVYVSEEYRTGGDPDSPMAMDNDSRPRVWKKVGEEILAHPLTGAGFGRAVLSKAYPALLPADQSRVFWHPHNLVLTYGVSAGVPGMVAVLALFASLAWRFWQLACRGEPLARLAGLAGTVMVAGVLARNMTNDFFVRDGALLFWALAGMLFGYALRRPPASGADEADLRPARRGVVVGSAAAGDRGRERVA
jgi:O-antigen ligase